MLGWNDLENMADLDQNDPPSINHEACDGLA